MNAKAAADWLYASIQARDVLANPPDGIGATLADAYAIQDALINRMQADDGAIAGWKVALTSPVMQEMCGVDHPCEGAVLKDRVLASPATCDTSKLGRLGVEAEIALVLGRDLPDTGAPYTVDSVSSAISAAHAAIELVDDRNADYTGFTAAKLAANNSLNSGIVVGPAVTDWAALDLSTVPGAMLIDGVVVAEGTGADILGHPMNAVAWLANSLIARGRMLRAGDIVMCGSFVRTQFPTAGQTVTCRVEGLGEACLSVS